MPIPNITIQENSQALLRLFDNLTDMKDYLSANIQNVNDIIVDQGRRPYYLTRSKEVKYFPREIITKAEFNDVLTRLNKPDELNRSILPGSLHRVSFINNKKDETYGLTIRNGRIIQNFTYLLSD